MTLRPMRWQDGALMMLDQRVLPGRTEWLRLSTWQEVHDAIRDMAVRGAPAIGVAAGYGMALAALAGQNLEEVHKGLAASRPTAVNLFWALDRISGLQTSDFDTLLAEAKAIEAEDLQANLDMARHGAPLIPQNAKILTVCNTGSLATAGHGTALGIIRTAHADGKNIFVYSCETRPRQQGLRLTAYELTVEKIPFKSIVDGAAASLMRAGEVDCVIAGADRIAANGDAANKIGTYSLAVLAKHHGIPFYIAAPTSTFDVTLADGAGIPIEERDASEIIENEGGLVGPANCPVWNPGFDVTSGELISAIVTEKGLFRPPYDFKSDGSK